VVVIGCKNIEIASADAAWNFQEFVVCRDVSIYLQRNDNPN
jgi:chemotaxis methyl-accepting protein methylase